MHRQEHLGRVRERRGQPHEAAAPRAIGSAPAGRTTAHTVTVRSVRLNLAGHPPVLAASAALLLVTLVSCFSNRGSSDVTTITFDGQTHTINGEVTCSAQPDGKLVILAADGVQKTVRVLLRREHRLVVEKVGLRFLDVSGFTDTSSEMWATKVDNTYKIDGRMPPNTGEMTSHQFEIETTCRNEVPPPYAPPPPRGAP